MTSAEGSLQVHKLGSRPATPHCARVFHLWPNGSRVDSFECWRMQLPLQSFQHSDLPCAINVHAFDVIWPTQRAVYSNPEMLMCSHLWYFRFLHVYSARVWILSIACDWDVFTLSSIEKHPPRFCPIDLAKSLSSTSRSAQGWEPTGFQAKVDWISVLTGPEKDWKRRVTLQTSLYCRSLALIEDLSDQFEEREANRREKPASKSGQVEVSLPSSCSTASSELATLFF